MVADVASPFKCFLSQPLSAAKFNSNIPYAHLCMNIQTLLSVFFFSENSPTCFFVSTVWYEPTDLRKATKPFLACETWNGIAYTSPNLAELKNMIATITSEKHLINGLSLDQPIEEISEPIIEASRPLLDHMHCIMVTLGRHGMLASFYCAHFIRNN